MMHHLWFWWTVQKNIFVAIDRQTSDKMCDRKAVIKNADMSEEMQQDAVDCATQALEKFNIEKVRKKFSCLLMNQ